MSIMRFKPVSLASKRQLTMHGIKVFDLSGNPIEECTWDSGIQLTIRDVVDAKTKESVTEKLRANGVYDLIGEVVTVTKVTGKDPLLFPDIDLKLQGLSKYTTTLPLISRGWEGPVVYRFCPIEGIEVEELLGARLGQLIVTL